MSSSYKEIIYLNKTELNSALSQINQGMLESLVERNSNSKSTTKEAGKSSKVSGGFSSFFNGGVGATDKDAEQLNTLFGEEKNIVLNDFKLTALINDVKPKELDETKEGDFIINAGKFNISDFNFTEAVLADPRSSALSPKFKSFMKDIDAWDKSTESGFKLLNHYIQYVNSLTLGNLILSMNGIVGFTNKDNFRINSGELQALAYTHRSITVLGIVEAIIEDTITEVNEEIENMFDVTSTDQNIFKNFGKIVPKLTELTFLTTNVMNKGDKFIRPIALFFD